MQLRHYQHDAVQKTIAFLKEKKGNPCVIAPTGSGKSLIIAELISQLNAPTLLLSHRKEILEQNEEKLLRIAPHLQVGVYSASLKRKQIRPVTIAQIQSIAKRTNSNVLNGFKYALVDECHLVPTNEESQYQKVLKACGDIQIIGLTATPYRLDNGSLIGPEKTFNDVSFEIKVKDLIDQGFLSPLVGKSSVVQADLDGVQKRGGEYVLEDARKRIDIDKLTIGAIQECLKYAHDRKAWIIFASGVEHAQKISNAFSHFGISNHVITGDTMPLLRDKYISEFKNNKVRALVNCDVLTTGFDSPNVDCIVLLRATASTSLYVQIVGRGMRIYEGKENCLVLDFAGNLERHGPIDLIDYRDFMERKKGDGEAPGKVCPECRTMTHASALECAECGFIFPEREVKHDKKASDADPMSVNRVEPPQEFPVQSIDAKIQRSAKEDIPMLVVLYHSGFNTFKEYVCFDHIGFARQKACEWWHQRAIPSSVPINSEDALSRITDLYEVKSVWCKKETINKPGKMHTFFKVLGVTKTGRVMADLENEEILF